MSNEMGAGYHTRCGIGLESLAADYDASRLVPPTILMPFVNENLDKVVEYLENNVLAGKRGYEAPHIIGDTPPPYAADSRLAAGIWWGWRRRWEARDFRRIATILHRRRLSQPGGCAGHGGPKTYGHADRILFCHPAPDLLGQPNGLARLYQEHRECSPAADIRANTPRHQGSASPCRPVEWAAVCRFFASHDGCP